MNLRDLCIIAIGGAIGAVARHSITVFCTTTLGDRFPWGTLCVNVAGCFLLGALLQPTLAFADTTKLALGTGFLGALTTFSTFGVQTLHAWQRSPFAACANIGANLALGLLAAAMGMHIAAKWSG